MLTLEKKAERARKFSVMFRVEETCSAVVVQDTNDVIEKDKAETDTGETL